MKILIVLAIAILPLIGWILNIVKIISCDWAISAEEVLRVVGIFVAPLGAVLGFVGHF
jgi:hypothetical protein